MSVQVGVASSGEKLLQSVVEFCGPASSGGVARKDGAAVDATLDVRGGSVPALLRFEYLNEARPDAPPVIAPFWVSLTRIDVRSVWLRAAIAAWRQPSLTKVGLSVAAATLPIAWLAILVVVPAIRGHLPAHLRPPAASASVELRSRRPLPRPPREMPPTTGTKVQLSQANIRYCLFQQVRLEAMGPLTEAADLAVFGGLVSDWNARCGRPHYAASDKDAVDVELVDRRPAIEAEGRVLLRSLRHNSPAGNENRLMLAGALGGFPASMPPAVEASNASAPAPDPAPTTPSILPPVITGQPASMGLEGESVPSKEPSLMLQHAYVAARVQKRLSELGYTITPSEGTWGPMSRTALRRFKQANGLLWDDALDAETVARLFSMAANSAPAGGGAQADDGSSPFETAYPPPPRARMNPLNRSDAIRIRHRLVDLGYNIGDAEGTWGIASRVALREFKAANQLPNDDEWDSATEVALMADEASGAAQTFVGRWPKHSVSCQAATIAADDTAARIVLPEDGMGIADLKNLCRAGTVTADAFASMAPKLPLRRAGGVASDKPTATSAPRPPARLPAQAVIRAPAEPAR